MFRRLAPRRLGTDEEATVVEHLTELRHRLLIAIAAIIPAFLLTFAFHTTLIEWLKRPLPPDKTLVTLGVLEPFTTAVKVSMLAAVAIVLPILIWQVWGFLAPAVDQATQRVLRVFIVIATLLFATGVTFAYFVVLPAAIKFLTSFDDTVYNVQLRASYYLSFTSLVLLASGLAFEMPIFILALVRIRVLSYDRLRRNRKIGYALMVGFAVLLPTVDPVSLLFETIPLLILFEASIWLARVMEKRWNRNLPDEDAADDQDDADDTDDTDAPEDDETGIDDDVPEDDADDADVPEDDTDVPEDDETGIDDDVPEDDTDDADVPEDDAITDAPDEPEAPEDETP
ncbi:MAG: twin-arginine translocase subunit TatC [Thermoleophilia bacterium]|nr:twin-arginine translocase subunit TatC [Thermoleophilia bacterium]